MMYNNYFKVSKLLNFFTKILTDVNPTSQVGMVLSGSGAARTRGDEGTGA
jgi:hypothetical protein